ncbi:hypothetical protein B0T20DRAFT_426568 [Sordaria brevicollis]|uniref:Uncharacterized protein n=1 Tax=Sordaria brevicollis TaxID=83679 RepID=A0AAE0NVI4_SORBR|nr:hypothetical protein B0T20DRAFT_426568 [Sordaria brevicollis]
MKNRKASQQKPSTGDMRKTEAPASNWATYLASTTAQNASSRGITYLDMLATPLTDVNSLSHLDPNTLALSIDNKTPSTSDWEIISSHFTKVQKLYVSTGVLEEWLDNNFPLHWPLDLLVLSGAATTEVTTPAILEGRIEHMVFYYCHNLQWQGLENWESLADVLPFVDVGETEEKWALKLENWTPRKFQNRMLKHYVQSRPQLEGKLMPTKTKTLEILGNNAISMFIGFCLECFPVAAGLESVTLSSGDNNDVGGWIDDAPEEVLFATFLMVLEKLKVSRLSVGERLLTSRDGLETPLLKNFLRFLPSKLEEFHFRGPVGLAQYVDEWVEALGDKKVLPALKKMSFVLDRTKDGEELDEKAQQDARLAAGKLRAAVATRGVLVQDFEDPWNF